MVLKIGHKVVLTMVFALVCGTTPAANRATGGEPDTPHGAGTTSRYTDGESIAVDPKIVQPTTRSVAAPFHKPLNGTLADPLIKMAVKTNVALLAAGVSNLGIEMGFGSHYSVDLPLVYSPYSIKRNYNLQLIALQPEFRYWLDGPMRGHFFGLHGTVGWFNVATNSKHRYQDNRPLWGVGVSYGYYLPFNTHWGAEFTLGGGYANIGYNAFYNTPNGAKYETDTKHYWGITRVGITLVYTFDL